MTHQEAVYHLALLSIINNCKSNFFLLKLSKFLKHFLQEIEARMTEVPPGDNAIKNSYFFVDKYARAVVSRNQA